MKKTLTGWLLAIPALFGFGLTSCQNDDADLSANVQTGETVYLTLEAGLPGDITRATFAPESETGNILKFAWEANDIISVVNSDNGKWLGNLKVKEIKTDKTKCTFDGQIIDPGTTCTLKFYYLDTLTLPKKGADVEPLSLDFSTQNGQVSQFGETDILMASKTYTGGVKGNIGLVDFNRDFAYAKFVLKYNNEVINLGDADVTISASEGIINNVATLDLQKGEYTFGVKEGDSDLHLKSPGNNFYVKFFPSENVELKFTCTVEIDGVKEEFIGTRRTSNGNLVKNLYYTEQGSGLSMVVNMVHSDGRDDKYDVKVTGNLNYADATAIEGATINTTLPYDYTLSGNLDVPTREGYTFKGWGEATDATEAIATVKFDDKEVLEKTVYAIWEKNSILYKVILKDDDPKTPESIEKSSKEDSQKIDLPTPEREGYEFVGWKEEDADNESATKGQWTLTASDPEVTLIPVWDKIPFRFIYNPNWNELKEKTFSHFKDVASWTHTVKDYDSSDLNFTREGYKLVAWNTKADGTGTSYAPGYKYTLTNQELTVTVYAIWKKNGAEAVVIAPGSEGSDY